MDKPRTSSTNDEHSCILCEKLGSSSKTNAELGDIIKIRNRRALTNKCTDIELDENMLLKIAQDKFLSNNKNKNHLIEILRLKLTDNNIFTCQAESDADKLIVDTAINLKTKNVVIVSEDIDILVILTALVDEDREIYFLKPSRGKVQQKIFSSKSLENSFPKCKEHILFLHAFTGCDTTSTFFKKGKIKFAKNFEKRHDLHESAKVFKNVNEDANNIFEAGITCILGLYGAPAKIKDLNTLRFNSFIKATAKKTSLVLSSLPPTTDAAFEHLKRVYLQIQIWLGNDVNIENWGWKYSRNMLIPVTMTQLPAPDNLLQMLFCNCKKGCGAACGCRKSGLYCSVACLQCNDNCSNTQPIIQINEVEENI